MSTKKILITGGAGFIGSNLVFRLVSCGNYKVTILDNFNEQVHGAGYKKSELYSWLYKHTQLIEADILDKENLKIALSDQDIVVHLAAETGTGQSMYTLKKYAEVNQTGTALLLEVIMAEGFDIDKVILASSRAIYGEGKYRCKTHGFIYPKSRDSSNMEKGDFSVKCPLCGINPAVLPTDENSMIHPESVYGITKYNQEQFLLTFSRTREIPVVLLRFQNVYGPGQSLSNPYTGILSIFSNLLLNKKSVNIFEDGQESRDFVFIDDVIEAIILSIEKEMNKDEQLILNVGSGERVTVFHVATKLKEIYKVDTEINVTGNFRKGDIRHNVADLDMVKRFLGYFPKTNFDTGLRKFSKWVLEQNICHNNFEDTLQYMKSRGILK